MPKLNFVIIVSGLFFAVQAKLFGFMGSAFLMNKHQIIYILCFIFAYILLGISSLVEFGTSAYYLSFLIKLLNNKINETNEILIFQNIKGNCSPIFNCLPGLEWL